MTTSNHNQESKSNGDGAVKSSGSSIDSGQELLNRRSSGILLHPTSLPGPHGIGDLGPWALTFLDFVQESGCCLWQVLPLGPTGYGCSPYQCTSSFAGNPLLISLERLSESHLLEPQEVENARISPANQADFDAARNIRTPLLEAAFHRFREKADPLFAGAYEAFRKEHAWWLEDFVLYEAIKSEHNGKPWFLWPSALVHREPEALESARHRLQGKTDLIRFIQFIFFVQWNDLRKEAHERGIYIVGDIPIFPAHDSADVWASPEIFKVDERGMPSVVAGVPPDYFSEDGQLWGNPLYRWDILKEQGYGWWINRFRHALSMVDIVRIDHFRGFAAAWEVSSTETTARNGEWVPGPKHDLFQKVSEELGTLPLIAEDLGFMTSEVEQLRTDLGLPGMKILQFAFDSDSENPYLPHNITCDSVVYTGTHDNDTTRGYFDAASSNILEKTRHYIGGDRLDIPWDIIRLAYASVAHTAIIPLQDILCLGTEARMNFPGKEEGNWIWRFVPEQLDSEKARSLRFFSDLYGRRSQ